MNYIQYVNTKQGSKSIPRYSNGNTLPLVQLPFGFCSFVPQTSRGTLPWFYHSDHTTFEGIRISHQPSPWIGDHGSMLIMPQNGKIYGDVDFAWTSFDKKNEVLQPHYMKFHLNRYKADIELTPTTYGACIQVEYHRDVQNYFAILPVRDNCEYRYDAEKNMLYCSTDFQAKGCDKGVLHSYFVYSFEDGAIDAEKSLVSAGKETKNGTQVSGQNTAIHLAVTGKKLTVKMAESYISYEQAEQNLINDSTYNSFDELKERNEEIWNSCLSRIKIKADEDVTKTFYSCMYRVFLYPHKAYEIDKNGNAIHYAPSVDEVRPGIRYTDNGFWDTYRTVYPLFSLIAKEEYKDIMEGYIVDYIDGGWLPRWTAMCARACMPSSLIDAVIADAAVKGILKGDLLRTAFEGMEKHANQDSDNNGYGREKVAFYLEHGYVPCDDCGESVNKTLDAAYGDWCIGVVAQILGEKEKAEKYFARSKNYKNVFDAETGFMRAKKEDGTFRDKAEDFSPIAWGRDYTEAAAWQTSFAVQHDFEGLAELYGGKDKLIAKLDELFSTETDFTIGGYIREIHEMSEAMNENYGQCFMSNQPSFHLPFIFSYLGQPEKTSYWVKKICAEGFSWRDDGFPGDEDNGTSAAWYIFACLGMYPLCPGKAEYVKFDGVAEEITVS